MTQRKKLPRPELDGDVSLEAALARRRSIRDFESDALTLKEVGQLLWAAQGVTARDGSRSAPSAGALYPLELYLAAGAVEGLEAGLYHYVPKTHALNRVGSRDVRPELAAAAVEQEWLADAPVVLLIAAEPERTTSEYGPRATRFVHMEVGYASQNVYLQATALGLVTVAVGAFHEVGVSRLVGLSSGRKPLLLMPVGR
jgi:SagB-type dehydrogenase family enzyme